MESTLAEGANIESATLKKEPPDISFELPPYGLALLSLLVLGIE